MTRSEVARTFDSGAVKCEVFELAFEFDALAAVALNLAIELNELELDEVDCELIDVEVAVLELEGLET